MKTVLFVCTANRYRSPIAAACFSKMLLERRLEREWKVLSAGTWTVSGLPPLPEAVWKAKDLGLDILEHRSQSISPELMQQADLILTMERGQKEALQNEFRDSANKVALLSEVVEGISYDIPDPGKDPSIAEAASKICELIHSGFEAIFRAAKASLHI